MCNDSHTPPQKFDPLAKLLFVLISLTFVVAGAMAIITRETPPSSTRHGYVESLHGRSAVQFGMIVLCFGLIPLAVFAKTSRQAVIWAVACVLAAAIVVVVNTLL
jgi:hypothetical protein